MKFEFERKDRRGFLQQVGKTAAVGLGIALYPAVRANASTDEIVRCCIAQGQCPGTCPPSDAKLYCSSIGCCVCELDPLDQFGCKNYMQAPC